MDVRWRLALQRHTPFHTNQPLPAILLRFVHENVRPELIYHPVFHHLEIDVVHALASCPGLLSAIDHHVPALLLHRVGVLHGRHGIPEAPEIRPLLRRQIFFIDDVVRGMAKSLLRYGRRLGCRLLRFGAGGNGNDHNGHEQPRQGMMGTHGVLQLVSTGKGM